MAPIADKVKQLAEPALKFADENRKAVAIGAGVTAAGLAAAYAWRRAANYVPTSGPYPAATLPADAYDGASVH